MKYVIRTVGVILAWAVAGNASDFDRLEKQFRELPMEARALTGPLFWMHGDETPAELEALLPKAYKALGAKDSSVIERCLLPADRCWRETINASPMLSIDFYCRELPLLPGIDTPWTAPA